MVDVTSPKEALVLKERQKSYKSLRKRIGSFEYDYHMKYMEANKYRFANEYALLSAKNNCNKPNEHDFRKFYNKLADFFN